MDAELWMLLLSVNVLFIYNVFFLNYGVILLLFFLRVVHITLIALLQRKIPKIDA